MEVDKVEGAGSSSTDDELFLADGMPIQQTLVPLQEFIQSVTSTTCAGCHKKASIQPGDVVKMTRNWIATDRGKSNFNLLCLQWLYDIQKERKQCFSKSINVQNTSTDIDSVTVFRLYHMRVVL